MTISENELLDELRSTIQREDARPDGYCTVRELSEASGKCHTTIRVLLRKLFLQGELEVQRVRQLAMDGRISPVPMYRLKQ